MEAALLVDETFVPLFNGTGSVAFDIGRETSIPKSPRLFYDYIWDENLIIASKGQTIPQILVINTTGTISDLSMGYTDELVAKRSNDYIARLIGKNGIERLQIFQNTKAGWDNGKGNALKETSVQILNSFSYYFSNAQMKDISLFMTVAGNLSILLRDRDNKVIELEFQEEGIEYFFERFEEEGKMDVLDTEELAKRIEVLLA